MGLYIASASFLLGFGLIWHIWWLATTGLLGVVALLMIRSFDYDTEYRVSAEEIAKIEAARN